jgi:hypothetical protein
MHLLIRRISEYTAAHVLLGVFPTAQAAEAAKAEYARRCATDPTSDPWREQAYKEAGLSERDLVVQELPAPDLVGEEVFVVSNYSEGFGQVVREFDSLHGTSEAAEVRVAELDAVDDRFPHYALVQRARVDVLLSDSADVQPRLN